MNFAQALACPVAPQPASAATLQRLFAWYLTLGLPYETLSNIAQRVFIKDAGQMLAAVLAGGGGHCVEHSVLLAALLREHGYDAAVINADFIDHQRQVRVGIAKPLVSVRVDGAWWICDPYYRAMVYPVPEQGTLAWQGCEITRLAPGEFAIARRQHGVLVDEDRANTAWTIATRRQQFATRYQDFSPFGVTAAFFQLLRPSRRAVFYAPGRDSLIVADGASWHTVEPSALTRIDWLPQAFVPGIVAALPALRAQRAASTAFLAAGAFPPFYARLPEAAPA